MRVSLAEDKLEDMLDFKFYGLDKNNKKQKLSILSGEQILSILKFCESDIGIKRQKLTILNEERIVSILEFYGC
ncbi:hypothetical protein HN011_005674 [Eciton burchellii]|jgi:co-chaperonin GroES (HSP10)|nr:hypothetical protein HN011_005674 [Eciton burchellii]